MAINEPGIQTLTKRADSTYTLVMMVSKRSRQLIEGAQPLLEREGKKPIAIAIEEIERGLVTFHRNLEDED
ncbi:MAG: DNA-directed RNA polymerase subunit omega [Eubacteriales bacterium]|jgi:DNA-directed RNA polymerase subunit omega|nr:DNA-directed RNA polymerase subunit omega [Eubacteriales bacterium]MDD3109515.1 DNA-directed RNA polymerase subunit omega [Eubacteriales bacterium]MDD3572261.1 DNA-directed RNA polymerase subunit omega [Eubacteriales bacterium]MDD4135012.1 DNA-directed RNA polymerase subunit omega [Eubacteriales bacterium]NLO14023.1 DNA-directed RNA polymerase subunit omega [Clostridiales bacterium]